MENKRLQQYRGLLSAADVAQGMNAASRNARRLAADARLILNSTGYATSFALACLSIEESGKSRILRELALAHDENEAKECWREYRSHTSKNLLWPLIDAVAAGARRAKDLATLLNPDAEHTYLLDKLKQISLYTDCFRKGHWSVPADVIDKELAESLALSAEVLASAREISTEEIELWIQYMQPVWRRGKGAASMEEALFQWDKEIRRRGLADANDSGLEAFFKVGFPLGKYGG
jgi:AbiV family abortive infection protein